MAVLTAPSLIYVFSSILVPVNASEVASWREYFYSVRTSLFVCGTVMVAFILFVNPFFIGLPIVDPSQAPLFILLGILIVGAVSDRPGLHSLLALAPPLVNVGILLSIGQTDWIAR